MALCNHLIVHCMDYRIQETVNAWIHRNGFFDDIDRIAVGGSCKEAEFILKFIDIAVNQHGVTKIFLSQHEDCAGYGGHAAFKTLDEERTTLLSDMEKLKAHIGHLYSLVKVVCLMVQPGEEAWDLVEID
jgi:carbonic anhydrase